MRLGGGTKLVGKRGLQVKEGVWRLPPRLAGNFRTILNQRAMMVSEPRSEAENEKTVRSAIPVCTSWPVVARSPDACSR